MRTFKYLVLILIFFGILFLLYVSNIISFVHMILLVFLGCLLCCITHYLYSKSFKDEN